MVRCSGTSQFKVCAETFPGRVVPNDKTGKYPGSANKDKRGCGCFESQKSCHAITACFREFKEQYIAWLKSYNSIFTSLQWQNVLVKCNGIQSL